MELTNKRRALFHCIATDPHGRELLCLPSKFLMPGQTLGDRCRNMLIVERVLRGGTLKSASDELSVEQVRNIVLAFCRAAILKTTTGEKRPWKRVMTLDEIREHRGWFLRQLDRAIVSDTAE